MLKKEPEWSPNLSYAVGLLATDGNLSQDGRHITMRSSDLPLLKTFKKCLKLSNRIGSSRNNGWSSKPCYRIQFSNTKLYHWLNKKGLYPAKTYSIGKIDVPDIFFPDFLRGHLDGDGCITTYIDRYNIFKNPKYIYQRLTVRFASASKAHIEWLRKKIIDLANLKGHLWEKKPARSYQKASLWYLKFGKKESIELLNWIYYKNNVPCLRRKRAIAEEFLVQEH